MDYDEHYGRTESYFGVEPDSILLDFVDRLPAGATVLDVGAGQGRHSFPLVRRGFEVTAIEPSRVAADAMRAADERPEVCNLSFDSFEGDQFDAVLVFGLFPDLGRDAIDRLVDRIHTWTHVGSILWVTGFTTVDPAYATHRQEWTERAPHSFENPEGRVRTYLEPGEILRLFPTFDVLHHWEGLGPEHRHGDGPPERHSRFEAVLERSGRA